MLNTIIGGLLAILGGFIASWLQMKYSLKVKMNEAIAQKKVTANAEAYSFMKEITSLLGSSKTEKALHQIIERESWFFSNRLFLPGRFPDKWLTVRNGLQRLYELERGTEDDKSRIPELRKSLNCTAEEGILEIYKEMNLKPIEVENLRKGR
ncbi:hypothetical protein [Desulforhabdus sp. TSK]|uniref:hypothetical protein n=1 Tax=Desulforhabdus sp. TSK TaxID=2925014 RepID=UPI001FC8D500|nr:hypothetical protein [Desulforhabdus sp. TSK]GKT07171.1 hypothetical protein DSTSK_04760 [Desulforhabdus sp. TSK]